MMRIVIAGHNGFAQLLAVCIKDTTPHQLIMLSHNVQPDLEKQGWQVFATRYTDAELNYLLTGADLVISTVAGSDQIALIEAAVTTGVPRFVPSEFSGLISLQPVHDPTDKRRQEALSKLQQYQAQGLLRFTVFSCGLFFEHFGPGGLQAVQVDMKQQLGNGRFLINMEDSQIMVPSDLSAVHVSMISARDAARCIVAALALPQWPTEFTFCAERLSLNDVREVCERVKGVPFQQMSYDFLSLRDMIHHAQLVQDQAQEMLFSQMHDVWTGRFDLGITNLDSLINIQCERFEDWLRRARLGQTS